MMARFVRLCVACALGCHVLGTRGEHMLSRRPRADIEDEERQYFKANVFPVVKMPQSIRRGVLTGLPWTAERGDLHTNAKGATHKVGFPRLNRTGRTRPPKNGIVSPD